MPVIAGVFALPEIIDGLTGKKKPVPKSFKNYRLLGILSVLKFK